MKHGIYSFCSVLDALEEPVFILSQSGGCEYANPAMLGFLGEETTPLRKLKTADFWPGAEAYLGKDGECSAQFERGGHPFMMTLRSFPLENGSTLFRAAAGEEHGGANFHAQRLQTLGMLAGGVAHDFNNILTGILGHITYLKTVLPAAGIHSESLTAIEEGARKASLVTKQILDFSRLDTTEKAGRVDLCDLVRRTYTLLRGAISPRYDLKFHVPGAPLFVLTVEGKLAQVIINLVINARDAIEPDGLVEILLERCPAGEHLKRLFETDLLSAGCYARLSVRDNGSGMSEEVLKRAFEPYFTTKGSRGTGLGLSTVSAIIRQFGGAIEVSSRIGEGTVVDVYLPVVEAGCADDKPKRSAGHPAMRGGNERILVVDDEFPVRNVLSLSLEHLGYRVEIASSGSEAIEKYKAAGGAFDLVILDMLMPQLSGDQVFFRLQEINPALRAVVISGYSSEEAVRSVLDHGGCGFIQKPFTIDELARRVRECIDAGESPESCGS